MIALVVCLGLSLLAFGLSFLWLAFRHRDEEPELFPWALANAGFHIAVGTTVVTAPFLPAAGRFAAAAVVLALVVAKAVARRRAGLGTREA